VRYLVDVEVDVKYSVDSEVDVALYFTEYREFACNIR
jgi:hypothetical protein